MKTFYVYIMSSKSGTLYVGLTSDIKKRIYEHKNHLIAGFTDKYNIDCLLYIETMSEPTSPLTEKNKLRHGGVRKRWNLLTH